MNILGITRFIIMPFLLWRAKRRSKADNQLTLSQLQAFSDYIKTNKSKL
jgi:hypothetical protein